MKVLHRFEDLDCKGDLLVLDPSLEAVDQADFGTEQPSSESSSFTVNDSEWPGEDDDLYDDDFEYPEEYEDDYDDFEEDDYYRHRDWQPAKPRNSRCRW